MTDMDYVVVGAGSAGCAVACRLVEGGANVALLEARPKDRDIRIHVPAALRPLLYRDKVNWNFHTEPVESTGGRRVRLPRGKVLGGSSSINGMLYVRGNAADFDGWAQMGCHGWSYQDVLPYFQKSESYKQGGDSEYRGGDGPLSVEDYRTVLPLTHRFVEAAQQAGFPFTPDYNGEQEGVGYSQMTRRGRSGLDRTDLPARRSRQPEFTDRDRCASRHAHVRRAEMRRRDLSPGRTDEGNSRRKGGDPVRRRV